MKGGQLSQADEILTAVTKTAGTAIHSKKGNVVERIAPAVHNIHA
jgi:hypothetical protein